MGVTKIAIYGFNRLGRAVFTIASRRKDLQVVAIFSRDDAQTNAQLLLNDDVYAAFDKNIAALDNKIICEGFETLVISDDITNQWRELGVDMVIDCFASKASRAVARKHLEAGAKKVVFTAPGDLVEQICLGVNEEELAEAREVISTAGATISAVAPVREIVALHCSIGAMLVTTVDGVLDCNRQNNRCCEDADNSCNDCNCYKSTQNRALPAPVLTVSMSEFVFATTESVTQSDVNSWIMTACQEPYYQGIVSFNEDAMTSDQAIGESFSAIVDVSQTDVQGGKLVSVKIWYDREWGYANRVVEITADFAKAHQKNGGKK